MVKAGIPGAILVSRSARDVRVDPMVVGVFAAPVIWARVAWMPCVRHAYRNAMEKVVAMTVVAACAAIVAPIRRVNRDCARTLEPDALPVVEASNAATMVAAVPVPTCVTRTKPVRTISAFQRLLAYPVVTARRVVTMGVVARVHARAEPSVIRVP